MSKNKRNLLDELMHGVGEMQERRTGKLTLRQIASEAKPAPEITAEDIVRIREQLNMCQAVFAQAIRTSTATLRNWERKKAKPNAQAALLIKLVASYPDTVQRINRI